MAKEIIFDRPKLKRLKKAYDQAVKENKTSFMFEGNELVVGYAKYLIEYLDSSLR